MLHLLLFVLLFRSVELWDIILVVMMMMMMVLVPLVRWGTIAIAFFSFTCLLEAAQVKSDEPVGWCFCRDCLCMRDTVHLFPYACFIMSTIWKKAEIHHNLPIILSEQWNQLASASLAQSYIVICNLLCDFGSTSFILEAWCSDPNKHTGHGDRTNIFRSDGG